MTEDWKRIPVRRLRAWEYQLAKIQAELEEFYPGICASDEDAEFGDDQTEFARNLFTAAGHLPCWINARVQGARKDPRE